MKYKLIVFDFDGTLANTFPWFTSVINQIADTYKFKKIDANEADILRDYSARKIINHLEIPSWKVPIIARDLRSLMAKDIEKITLFEGIDVLLQQLSSRGVTLAIVSSNSYNNISQILGSANMSHIDFAECGVSLFGKVSKLKKIVNKSRIDTKDAIFIGDEVRDIEAAKRATISSGAVSWGYNKIEKLKKTMPDEVFFDSKEILEKTT